MEHANEPLARRLRDAAIDRTATDAERVDDFVLDKDGVLDLRELEHDALGTSAADPARALAAIKGQLGNAHEVSELYDDSEPSRRWRVGRRTHPSTDATVVPAPKTPADRPATRPNPPQPLNRLSTVPLTAKTNTDEAPADPDDREILETTMHEGNPVAVSNEPEIDLRDEARPTADCPKCAGLGHRDLFDRFSQVEFYSCDNCMHMWQQDVD